MNATDPILRPGEEGEINLGVAGSRCVYACPDLTDFAFQVEVPIVTGWPASAVVTARVSQDGMNFYSVGTPATLSAVGVTANIDVSAYKYVALVVTTAGGSVATAKVYGNGKRIPA